MQNKFMSPRYGEPVPFIYFKYHKPFHTVLVILAHKGREFLL